MTKNRNNRSAGIGDPYWYEWGIGLLKAVEMLNPDAAIDAVAFQKEGIKGWDDVVIRYHSGRIDYYQVKHSKPKTNLTFSDLVGKADDRLSLLGSLTSSWYEMKLCNTDSYCTLITNRSAGTKAGYSSTGIFQPPLANFIRHISAQVKSASKLSDISVPNKWDKAWTLWISEMGSISDDSKLQFLKRLTVTDDAPELQEMPQRLADLLASFFQITNQQANVLVQRLLSSLFEWTTSIRGVKEWISAEDMMSALSESEPEIFGYCDVPTPAPFFPSREQAVTNISSLLTGDGKHRIIFLEAEPGSGKTSVVSRIVNQRADDYSSLVVDLRYYAYKPITPDAPALSADADRSASPESLWYALLSQIRQRLRGRLFELGVPVRNNFVKPYEARDHVLRLSALLAQQKRSPFVIVIDGVDHAARAHRKGLPSLIGSLPSPEIIPAGVRFLIAGQPSSAYPEYPMWLRNENEMVERVALGAIDALDIELLLLRSNTEIPREDHGHAVRIALGVADGNTLATVFAVAEAESCITLSEFKARLSQKRLHSGVHEYYSTIWHSAVPDSPAGLRPYLSFVLCILRERITGDIMHKAFSEWCKPAPEWNAILKKLEPLVVCDPDGYRVRHNDIRVFLEQELRADEASMQNIASLLADYYMGSSATPIFRQVSLFNLLQLAGREVDKARVFNPKWVLDAVAYGQDLSVVFQEAEDAFRAIPVVKDWDIALKVVCGGMTLSKLSECLDAFPDLHVRISKPSSDLPQCLETERFVPPLNQWDYSTFRLVLDDAKMLADRGETNRAKGLMEQWTKGLLPATVVSKAQGIIEDIGFQNGFSMNRDAELLFEDWGALVFRLGIPVKIEQPAEDIQNEATCFFERGWISECISNKEPDGILSALRDFKPSYYGTVEVAIEKAATKRMWGVVAGLLNIVKDQRDSLSLEFRVKAIYWSLMAMQQDTVSEWIEVLPAVRSGKWNKTHIEMPLMIFVAKSIGWLELHREAAIIAEELSATMARQGRIVRNKSSLFLPLQAAAMIGKAEKLLLDGDIKNAAVLLPVSAIKRVIELIWDNQHILDFHEYRSEAMELTFALVRICNDIGHVHADMVLSLAVTESKKFPVDQKMVVLWEVLRRAGKSTILRAWAEHWIGQDGTVWSGLGYSERPKIVCDLSRLCRDEGWVKLAEYAEERWMHQLIGYSGHKEYSFQEPLDWVVELFGSNPSAWQEEGIQLLGICRECDNQGGDNRLSSEIEKEVAAAAFRCGPDNAFAFFNWIDPEVESYWLQTVRSTIIAASDRSIADRIITELNDILALWCCSIGLTRWFNKNHAKIMTAFRDTMLKEVGLERRDNLLYQLKNLSEGEFLREEYDQDQRTSRSSEDINFVMSCHNDLTYAVIELAGNTDEDSETSLREIFRMAMHVARENPINRTELMDILFGLFGANRRYSYRWDYWGRSLLLKELIALLREEEIWNLMRAIIRTTGEEYWLLSIPHNIHLICLYRAAAEGGDRLKVGSHCMLDMHRLWSGLSECQATEKYDRGPKSDIDTWSGFAANVLYQILRSDSAETVTAALRGLCALAEIAPEAVSSLFDGSLGVQRSRLLLGAEVWVARQPKYFTSIIEGIWKNRAELSFSDRIQSWICINTAKRVVSSFSIGASFIPNTQMEPSTLIVTKSKRILDIAPEMQGCVPIANIFSVAKNWISRFGSITGGYTDDLENAIAEEINARGDELQVYSGRKRKKRFATEDGDMIITTHRLDSIFDKALEQELCKPIWNDEDAGDVAMAVTPGDDPWILRCSPLPSPAEFDWPDQKQVDEWLDTDLDNANVQDRLKLLLKGGDLSENQQVLGSYLRVFTSHYDCEIWYWLEACAQGDITVKRAPVCPSSRSFQFFLPERFEPNVSYRYPLVFFSRSILRLSFSTLEIVPAKVLQDQMVWDPQNRNPLVWTKEGREVAKYEIYHGPLEYNWSRRNMRHSTLSRWVVDADELKRFGYLSSKWDYSKYPFLEK